MVAPLRCRRYQSIRSCDLPPGGGGGTRRSCGRREARGGCACWRVVVPALKLTVYASPYRAKAALDSVNKRLAEIAYTGNNGAHRVLPLLLLRFSQSEEEPSNKQWRAVGGRQAGNKVQQALAASSGNKHIRMMMLHSSRAAAPPGGVNTGAFRPAKKRLCLATSEEGRPRATTLLRAFAALRARCTTALRGCCPLLVPLHRMLLDGCAAALPGAAPPGDPTEHRHPGGEAERR